MAQSFTNASSNVALINPEPSDRRNAHLIGCAGFLRWSILVPELNARIPAQPLACLLRDRKHKYSHVTLLERCCALVADQITSSISIRMRARTFNTNHNTPNEVFEKETGAPAWHCKLRQGVARQLRLADAPTNLIAANHDYELPSNFLTTFRRSFGVPPFEGRNPQAINVSDVKFSAIFKYCHCKSLHFCNIRHRSYNNFRFAGYWFSPSQLKATSKLEQRPILLGVRSVKLMKADKNADLRT